MLPFLQVQRPFVQAADRISQQGFYITFYAWPMKILLQGVGCGPEENMSYCVAVLISSVLRLGGTTARWLQ